MECIECEVQIVDGSCPSCGVDHSETCPACDRAGFHADGCPESDATFRPGQKVRTVFGEIRTVLFQDGCRVEVEEECGAWYHPSKLLPVAR